MKSIYLASCVILLSACSDAGDGTGTTNSSASDNSAVQTDQSPEVSDGMSTMNEVTAQPTDLAGYVSAAAAGDLWEIESSRALLAKSARPEVKKFAQMMIDNHSASTTKIKAAAAAVGHTMVAPKLEVDQQGMLDEIREADAKDIDSIYLRHQRAAHARALALHSGFAKSGDTPKLITVARAMVPIINQHIAEIDRISRDVPATGG